MPPRDPYGFTGTLLANRYQIEELIGIGGMAVVYRAYHLVSRKLVAIKILKPDLAYANPGMVEDFLNEARAIANLDHPHIIEVSDAELAEDGTAFMAMKYLKGQSLDDVLPEDGSLSLERVTALFAQICEAVEYAHHNGIIHRDLKPSNIMVVESNRGEEIVKILDFGIAKAMNATTNVSREVGTICYASPEQLTKGANIDHRSDIYSLGVILYQMLTGAVPYDDDSMENIIYQKLNFSPPPLRELRPDLSAAVEAVAARAIAKDPAKRFASATEFSREFQRAMALETGVLVVECVDPETGSKVVGASVYLNGKLAGQTDRSGQFRQSNLLPKKYAIEVETLEYRHWQASVRIASREEAALRAELQREPKGELVIACGIGGVEIELDDQRIGVTDETGRLYLEGVATGTHHVRMFHANYLATELEIEVKSGESAFVDRKLKPKKAKANQALVIAASLAGAVLLGSGGYYFFNRASVPTGKSGEKNATVIPLPPSLVPVLATPTIAPTISPSPSPSTAATISPSPTTSSTPMPSPSLTPTKAPKPMPTAVVPREVLEMRVSEAELRSHASQQTIPLFPPLGKSNKAGTVHVKVVVDETGRLVQASAYGEPKDFNKSEFTVPAEQAVRNWKFTPFKDPEGKKVKVSGEIRFTISKGK